MLISRVVDEPGDVEEDVGLPSPLGEPLPQCNAAEELFELMAKDSKFDPGEDTLTQGDLVLLYKNLDLGTQLMSNATVQQPRANQRVETIVYKGKEDDSEDSDVSPNYSNEDLQSLYLVNKTKSHASSHTLCNKFGNIDMNSSDLTMEYKKKFNFRDPYIQYQLQSLNLFSSSTTIEGIVPTSLLDYICCKRLEDNYNFYMDNIIKYVQHTLEQLKKISNGDYLTERVKEKWREVENKETSDSDNNTKLLATSTSIPLRVERKKTGHKTTWDDIVHSEVDIRSLSRILEKKIVIEIPKLITGSYKIMSKCCVDNLIVSCTKTKVSQESERNDSRVDVVFELKRSNSGHVTSDISSIMIVQTSSGDTPSFKLSSNENLPLAYLDKAAGGSTMSSITHHDGTSLELIPIQEVNLDSSDGPEKSRGSTSDAFNTKHKIIELNDSDPSQICILDSKDEDSDGSSVKCLSKNISADQFSTTLTSTEYEPAKDTQSEYNDVDSLSATPAEDLESEKSLSGNKEELGESTEVYFDFPAPDELGLSMRRLPVQGTLKEESEEDPDMNKKSQTKIRVKSPYENQSFVIEEKKRKRLLEIRERRERKKLTMQEFCKIVKHKYGKGFAMPQASSSVTKLSITNKSFYNSIYGQNTAVHTKQMRTKAHRRGHKRLMADMGAKKSATGDRLDLSLSSMNSERDSNKKFINRSFYLDEVETEMMNNMDDNDDPDTERKVEEVLTERSNESKDLVAELERLTGLIQPSNNVENVDIADSMARLNNSDGGTDKDSPDDVDDDVSEAEDDERSGNESSGEESESYNLKSRSKLNVTPEPYEGSPSTSAADVLGSKRSSTSVECRKSIERIYDLMKKLGKTDCFLETRAKGRSAAVTRTNSVTNPCSDSGTSRRHLSTNNSCQSFQTHDAQRVETRSQPRQQPPNAPQRNIMRRYDRNRHGRLNIVDDLCPDAPDATGDPIKTFSKLVHDIDSLANIPLKAAKATEVRPTRNLKMDEPKPRQLKKAVPKTREPYVIPPELRPRKRTPENKVANPRVDRFAKRKIIDIIDEEKEARGEAVRGPSKCRLNALAQPRKTYVQAHIAEVQNKYGRSAISDRLQRLAGGPPPSPVTVRVKPLRKLVPEALLDSSARHPPPATRTADFERARARDAAAAARRHAFDPTEPMSWDVETYVRRLRQRDVSQERSRAPRRQGDGAEPELGQTLLAVSTLQAISANSSPLRPASNRVMTAPNLSDLTELTESSRTPRTPRSPRKSPDSFQRPRGSSSPNSGDHVTDLLDMTPRIELKEEEEKDSDGSKVSKSKSNAEMATLEAALYRRRAKSAVHSRLRIKTLTLTPRNSLLALQSGDAAKKSLSGTKLVKSSDDIALLKSLTKGGLLEWNFKLKPQVTTVGFAFADFNKALEDKPREHFKSSSSGATSAHAERSADLTSLDRDHSKKASESTKSNTMTSDSMSTQYYAPEISPEAKKSEVSACVQADCKEFDNLFGVSLDDGRNIGKIVVHAKKTLVTDAMVDSAKLQASESRPVSSKIRTSGNSVQTVVENAVGYKSVIDVGVGSTESVAFSLSPRQKQRKTEHSVQTVDSFCSARKAINEAERMQRLNDAEPKANSNKTIEYSSSLDILVGLLNEIQTITTCQTNMTNKMSEKGAGNSFNTIFDRTTGRNLNHVLSITSLERMRQLESNASIYSFYVSNDGDRCGMDSIKSEIIQTSCLMDKEVNTSKNGRLVSCTTDVPSKIFYNITPPNLTSSHVSTVHQSTSVDSCIVRQSIISLHKYKPVSITEVVTEDCPSNKVHETNMTVGAKKVPSLARKVDESSRKVTNRRIKASYAKPSEWDPLMKMKRDILVAVYSMLVFTVFAALSFPDLMQYR